MSLIGSLFEGVSPCAVRGVSTSGRAARIHKWTLMSAPGRLEVKEIWTHRSSVDSHPKAHQSNALGGRGRPWDTRLPDFSKPP